MPQVFISYAGPLSHKIATELKTIIKTLLDVDVPLFPNKTGEHMTRAVLDALNESATGICCMTRDNVRSRWLYFEAGALFRSSLIPTVYDQRDPNAYQHIVPLYYPRRTHFPYSLESDPLREFKGVDATIEGMVELLTHLAGMANGVRPAADKIDHEWQGALERIEEFKAQLAQNNHVGRFSPFHDKIIDKCIEINCHDNDFRKFLCARMLQMLDHATDELASGRDHMHGFDEFATCVGNQLNDTTRIVALCGDKPWNEQVVTQYYVQQFNWAQARADQAQGGLDNVPMRRVFVKPAAGFSTQQQEIIANHIARRDRGVEARVIQAPIIYELIPELSEVWENLIGDGFGFIAMRKSDGWHVLAHMNSGKKFISKHFSSPYVVSAILTLFDRLWNAPGPEP